jgi:hypothetical protein
MDSLFRCWVSMPIGIIEPSSRRGEVVDCFPQHQIKVFCL